MAAAATDEVDDGDDGKRRLEGSLRRKTRHGGLDARPKGRHVPGDSAANHSGSISSVIGRCFGITRLVLDHIQPRREHAAGNSEQRLQGNGKVSKHAAKAHKNVLDTLWSSLFRNRTPRVMLSYRSSDSTYGCDTLVLARVYKASDHSTA